MESIKKINFQSNNTLQVIGNRAFRYCGGLEGLNIPNSVAKIGDYAFQNAFIGMEKPVTLNIPESVINIGQSAFSSAYIDRLNLSGVKGLQLTNNIFADTTFTGVRFVNGYVGNINQGELVLPTSA